MRCRGGWSIALVPASAKASKGMLVDIGLPDGMTVSNKKTVTD